MSTFPVDRPETGKTLSETHNVLRSEAPGSIYGADMSVDYESLNRKENEQGLAEQERSQSGSFGSRGTRSTEYERQILALASKGALPSLSGKSHNSDAQTSVGNKSASIASASLPQSRVRSSLGSSSSSRGKRGSQGIPGPELPANYISGTIIISKNKISPRQKQSTRQTSTSPLSPVKKSGAIITSNSRTTSASFNPPASYNHKRSSTLNYSTMSRDEQILPDAHPSPTSPIQKRGTITFSNSAPSGRNYTHNSAQTTARPTSMTLNEVKRLQDSFGIKISVTEPKGRIAELRGHWDRSRLVRIVSIVIIAFLMGLTEAWLVGAWYSNVYGGIYI